MRHFKDFLAYAIFVIALFAFTFSVFRTGAAAISCHNSETEAKSNSNKRSFKLEDFSVPETDTEILSRPVVFIPCEIESEIPAQEPPTEEALESLEAIEETSEENFPVDEAELEMLACTIYIEAGGDACSDETRMMVGNVVLNRIADERFPDTMEEVLLQPRQYNTFSWTGIQWPARASTEPEAEAVARAYDCARRLLEGERVLDADVVWQAEFFQGSEVVSYQDGIYFCR